MADAAARVFLETGVDMKYVDLIIDILGEPLPTMMHYSMFLQSIDKLGSANQKETWFSRRDVIGAYAQTELGWGSDVASIETVAWKTKNGWILHSPTLASIKVWPGGLGSRANHALVVARADIGLRMFIVPMSSKGVTRGTMGNLLGFQNADNGWLKMDHVHVPNNNALPIHNKRELYSTMVHTRGRIIRSSFFSIAKALTIAYSYASVRTQPKGIPIIQHKHIVQTLTAWTRFAEALGRFTYRASDDIALKAFVTDQTLKGIEACRRICGGHGYAYYSGFPELITNYMAAVTYEGSNEMLYAQSMTRSGKSLRSTKVALKNRVMTGGTPPTATLGSRIRAFNITQYEHNSILVAKNEEELYKQIWNYLSSLSSLSKL
tara:strand:+ start:2496 stop:3629 length:1134 start_codon:yes stop_codon:yes gene_type:complete